MGREPDQVGSCGEGPIGKVAAAGSSTGGKQLGIKKILRNNPGKIRSTLPGQSSEMSVYVLDMTPLKQVQAKSYIKTVKEIKRYIGSNYIGRDNIWKLLYKLSIIDITKPIKPTSLDDKFEIEIYKHEIKTYAKQRDHMIEGLKKKFHLIWGQCINPMISHIESIYGFIKIQINLDAIGLLIAIKSVQHEYKTDKHPVCALHMAKQFIYLMPHDSRSNQAFLYTLQALIDVLEAIGGVIGNNPSLISSVCHRYGLTPSTLN